jgi:hypothetical protein
MSKLRVKVSGCMRSMAGAMSADYGAAVRDGQAWPAPRLTPNGCTGSGRTSRRRLDPRPYMGLCALPTASRTAKS